jgi:hypothetical protein
MAAAGAQRAQICGDCAEVVDARGWGSAPGQTMPSARSVNSASQLPSLSARLALAYGWGEMQLMREYFAPACVRRPDAIVSQRGRIVAQYGGRGSASAPRA